MLWEQTNHINTNNKISQTVIRNVQNKAKQRIAYDLDVPVGGRNEL